MHRAFSGIARSGSQPDEDPVLALEIADMGANDGIDVIIRDDVSGLTLFETVLADPECRSLLTSGNPETETFWRCFRPRRRAYRPRHLHLTARCRFDPLIVATFGGRMGRAELRNVRFLRLVEELLDELRTREPAMSVEVAVTHRNPAFADVIGH